MSKGGHWNNAGRRSGGYRRQIITPIALKDDPMRCSICGSVAGELCKPWCSAPVGQIVRWVVENWGDKILAKEEKPKGEGDRE